MGWPCKIVPWNGIVGDEAEFQHNVEVFFDLCHGHIELEEKMIYPQARTLAVQGSAKHLVRTPQ